MLILLFIIIELLCSIRSASLGLAAYFSIRLCIPPYVRFAGLSCNTVLLLVFIMCVMIFHMKLFRNLPTLFKKYTKYVIGLFGGLCFVSFFSEYVPLEYQIKELIQFFVTEITPFLLIPLVIRKEREYKITLLMIAIASLFNVTYGMYTYVTNSNPLISYFGSSMQDVDPDIALFEEGRFGLTSKAVGIYSDKIFMALVSLLIFIFFYGKTQINRRLQIIVLVLSAMSCFFTTQRAPLLCLIIFYVIASDKKKVKHYLSKYLLFFIVFGSVMVSLPQFKPVRDFAYSTLLLFDDKAQSDMSAGGSSVSMRVDQLMLVADVAGPYIMQGLGYGFSSYRKGTMLNLDGLYGLESYAFQIIVNSGLIGMLFWMMFFYKLVKSSIANSNYDRKYVLAFNIAYLLAILMTDTSGSFYLYMSFLALNCTKQLKGDTKLLLRK